MLYPLSYGGERGQFTTGQRVWQAERFADDGKAFYNAATMNSGHKTFHAVLWGISALMILLGASLVMLGQQGRATLWRAATPAPTDIAVLPASPLNATPRLAGGTPAGDPTALPVGEVTLAWPALPADLETWLAAWAAQQPAARVVTGTAQANLWLSVDKGDTVLAERIYTPVARFATVRDDISGADLLALWLGKPAEGRPALAVTPDVAAGLAALWGQPAQVEIFPDAEAVAAALEQDPTRLGILAFDHLLPRVKALSVNGQDSTDNQFDPASYPLALRVYVHAAPEAAAAAAAMQTALAGDGLQTNRDPAQLTVVAMTGVTAMARMTALRMEEKGVDYPAAVVGPALARADITHISNEIPFTPDCQVNASENNLTLCSSPDYLQALRAVGVDIVGLTGNHLNDFGFDADRWSMQFYRDQNLPTYGGGETLEAALKPLLIEHNGNRLVFLGANQFGPPVAWAGDETPGSAPYDLAQLSRAITEARTTLDADVVLVELQWEESYDTLPILTQRQGFEALSAAGADIVTGVQSHVPQAVEFGQHGLILYGLGNFFFDQMWSQATREGLIPRHTIYQGRHLSTHLMTTMLEDFAQPRWTTDAERAALLERIFAASGW